MPENNLAAQLLAWYDQNGRALPWRQKGGAHFDPYVVLVSEIMLQQTTVKTVLSYFDRFMARFPTVESLASATLDEVYIYWQGLGYYTRARSLHASAQIIVRDMGGRFPDNAADAGKLKGLGAYTLASYLALAFNLPETVVDGNVVRIICRLRHWTDPADTIMPKIRKIASCLTDKSRAADYASAIMDLGAMICTPKNPQCLICPWQNACRSKGLADLTKIPVRTKTLKKEICSNVYIIRNSKGEIYIRKRVEKGLLSGLYEFPWGTDFLFAGADNTKAAVTHIFTHIRLTLSLYTVQLDNPVGDGFFVKVSDLPKYAFSTLMSKVWKKYNSIS